ncbi:MULTISPECIES: GntR family transcriptional regulator [unclassified Brachybacterium]|uniref:GntR family transcriptional regulator n=1 Tax=unclassified Brachybacterium TaxID=2623841 RepID=UPI003615EBC2
MTNPTPPYEQVRREIIGQVRSGELTPGDRLPAIRAYAGELGLAPGTVARAYRLLEEAEIIVTRRGAGTTVAPGAVAASEAYAAAVAREGGGEADPALVALFRGVVSDAREDGHTDMAILAAVREVLAGTEEPAEQSERVERAEQHS